MAKRKRSQSGFSARQAADAAEKRKQEQNQALVRSAGVLIVLVLIVIGVSVGISVFGQGNEAANIPGAAGGGVLMASERPLADISTAERNDYYEAAPEMIIDTGNDYQAVITLENGNTMTIDLFDDQAPVTVNNFVYLANQGFYDGTVFHRVIDGFMAQGGDPTGTGTGGPGYAFQDEFDPALRFDRSGLLAMANSGPSTNGSQFFITFAPTEWLNDAHTIFGELVEGDGTLSAITIREPGSATPADVIQKIEIYES